MLSVLNYDYNSIGKSVKSYDKIAYKTILYGSCISLSIIVGKFRLGKNTIYSDILKLVIYQSVQVLPLIFTIAKQEISLNIIKSNSDFMHHVVQAFIKEHHVAADCTLGNGNDTLWLLQSGLQKIYAFDIQKEAIDISKSLINSVLPQRIGDVNFILDSHENIDRYLENVDIIIFNLGYLPGGDKSVTTVTSSSLTAISKALKMLNIDGICAITAYSGHSEGMKEKGAIMEYLSHLDSSIFHVTHLNLLNQHNCPPELIFITRKKLDL